MGSMLRRIGLYLILTVYLFTISTVASAASNQTEAGSLSVKQKEEIKALVNQELQLQKEQIKKELLEELKKNQDTPKDSPSLDIHDPQLKLLK
jgi:hypothetical protein